MRAGLVSSAAYEIQLTADCELLLPLAQLVVVSGAGLEEAANGLAGDAEADDSARLVDFGDRVGRDEAAVPRHEAALDGQRVRDVGERSVHRALDLPNDAAAVVGNEEARGGRQIQGEGGHVRNLFPISDEIPLHGVRVLLTTGLPAHREHRDEQRHEVEP